MKSISCLAVLAALLMMFSCKKNDDDRDKRPIIDYKSQTAALILNTGPVAADGCGYLIKVDNTLFSPDNLSAEFQKDSLKVFVDITVLDGSKFQCTINPDNRLQVVHINAIERSK